MCVLADEGWGVEGSELLMNVSLKNSAKVDNETVDCELTLILCYKENMFHYEFYYEGYQGFAINIFKAPINLA